MSFEQHPLMQLVRTHPPPSDERKNAQRMAEELEGRFGALAAMEPNDPDALDSLKGISALLGSINQSVGVVHGWTRAQHAHIYAEACRLLGPAQTQFSAPIWVEP